MDFKSFKQIHKKFPFWKKLKWFYWSVESYQKAIRDREDAIRNGQDIDTIEHYIRERDEQFQRAEWLYWELLNMYKHEKQMRIMYQKMAKQKGKR